jgi:hypothetical protein
MLPIRLLYLSFELPEGKKRSLASVSTLCVYAATGLRRMLPSSWTYYALTTLRRAQGFHQTPISAKATTRQLCMPASKIAHQLNSVFDERFI